MWKCRLSALRTIRLRDYLIRFLFGGVISVIATLIGQWTTPRIGGIFTAFPAILLASLTLINHEDGQTASEEDAQGAVLGAMAFAVAAIVLTLTLDVLAGAIAILLSLGAWLVCSVGLYVLSVKCGWLHLDKNA